jgi:hypothetical protein
MYRLTAGGRAWAMEALTAAKSKARVTSRAARLGAPILERS